MGKRLAKKVLLIGWDAADWKIINPLLDSGQMPALEKLINAGVIGKIATLDPPLSPMLWTSIATGKTADKHGILGFVEPAQNGTGIRPVSSTSRKVKAIWNILTQNNFKTHTIGWWPSHPSEPINGVSISEFYGKVKDSFGKPWPMAKGTVHPEKRTAEFAQLRIHSEELTEAHLLPFVPLAAKVNQEEDKSLQIISKMLAECSSVQSAATYVLEKEEWDFMGVYFNAIDHFCHAFMKYHPPQLPGVPDNYFELYKDVVNSAYRFHDMMLERLVELAGEEATIILLSDHGFHSDNKRLRKLPEIPAAPAMEHSPFGIFCMKGPNIIKDERIYGASIIDITPTLLTLFGLPVGKDMDGKVLTSAFSEKIIPEFIPSWETVEGNSGTHPSEMQQDPWTSQEAVEQLIELGYVEKPSEDIEKTVKNITRESKYYLARVFANTQRYNEAAEILQKLFDENPKVLRFGFLLATAYQSMRKLPECRNVIKKLRESGEKEMPHLDFLEGVLLLGENKPLKAIESFKKAEIVAGKSVSLMVHIANAYYKVRRMADAEKTFRKIIEVDSESAVAHNGLAHIFLAQKKYEESAEEALTAVGLQHFFPKAHSCLGEALFFLEEYDSAEKAFNVSIVQNPANRRAHQWLVKIYSEKIKNPERLEYHSRFLKENIRGTINIVSGLPRSGTSLMMQMLKNGGANILTDNLRQPDDSNPKGYFEFEKVKKLHTDNTWVHEAIGKTVKIIAQQLYNLPEAFHYKIIFMERDMSEVMISQQKMLGKNAQLKANAFPVALADAFGKHAQQAKAWIGFRPNVEVLYVNYNELIANPEEEAQNIAAFFNNELNADAMLSAIDTKLYRNRQ